MKVALWLRVSGDEQDTDNQWLQLEAEAERRGFEVAKVYNATVSAFQGAHQRLLSEVYDDARLGRFDVLLCWALDRLSREGPLATLEIVHRLSQTGVNVASLQEPWLEVSGEFRDLLIAITGWVARMESERRSERTKAGLGRAKANGVKLGRPKGSRDKTKRSRRGYYRRYAG